MVVVEDIFCSRDAFRSRLCHDGHMAAPLFQVIRLPNRSFSVALTSADGRRKTVTGFESEHEAAAWIVQTERILQENDPRFRLPPRDKGRPSSATPAAASRSAGHD